MKHSLLFSLPNDHLDAIYWMLIYKSELLNLISWKD